MLRTIRFIRFVFGLLLVALLVFACESHTRPTLQKQSKSSTPLAKHNSAGATLKVERQFLDQLNKLRTQARKCGGKYFPAADPLAINDRLNQVAYLHSLDMYENNFLDHISSDGGTLVDRLSEVNYTWRAIGENVAHNQRTIEQVLQDWLSSPGHCSNMMSSEYRHTGIAQVNWYWTQVYAAPK